MTELEATRLKLQALELVEGTGLNWWEVIRNLYSKEGFNTPPALNVEPKDYELALGVIEGKPVWEGDKLWCAEYPCKQEISALTIHRFKWSWNPPKPATVMVELLVEDAEKWAQIVSNKSTSIYQNIAEACRKALEKLNENPN